MSQKKKNNKKIFSKINELRFYYDRMFFIRIFEKFLLYLSSIGKLDGTTHTCIGQESVAVGVIKNTTEEDFVISNHRGHGHFLSKYFVPELFLLELVGDKRGICKGKAGSQHVIYKNFYANGVLGNLVPVAAGISLSLKKNKKKPVVVVFLGDGVFGEGIVYETLNFASLYKLRCLFVVENNKIAQTTNIDKHLAGSIRKRFDSFGIKVFQEKTNDVENINKLSKKILENIRKSDEPAALIVNTVRLMPHSKGDDTRSLLEIKKLSLKDPIKLLVKKNKKFNYDEIEKNNIDKIIEISKNMSLKLNYLDVKKNLYRDN